MSHSYLDSMIDNYYHFRGWDKNGNIASKSVHQYGAATTNKNSPHYSDQTSLFANRQLKHVWFNKEEILELD